MSTAKPDTAKPEFIPVEQWGRDHYSTFAYICTCVVNKGGVLSRDRMRCNEHLHPGLTGRYHTLFASESSPHSPTRLKDGTTLDDHDDWSCADDLEAVGLIEWNGTGVNPVFALTEAGWAVWYRLERHISEHPTQWSETFDAATHIVPATEPGVWKAGG
jgi:hypothetical protein